MNSLWLNCLLLPLVGWLFVHCQQDQCAGKKISLSGAGSSFPALLYAEIGTKYSAERYPRRDVEYAFSEKNSGYGRERILSETHDPILFAASEGLLTQEEQGQQPHLLTFPVLAGALVVIYNVPEVDNAGRTLVLSTKRLVEIYSGIIKYWDHPAIVQVNPNVTFTHNRIRVVVRRDNSGDTEIITGAFSTFDEDWERQFGHFSHPHFENEVCCNSTKWPRDTVEFFAYRVTGMVGIVGSIPYTIGYAAKANVAEFSAQQAMLINGHNVSMDANGLAVQEAMDYHLARASGSITFQLSNALAPKAYPIASFSYLIINASTHPDISCCAMQEMVGFVYKLLHTAPSVFEKYSLVPLSRNVISRVEGALKSISCQDENVYEQYQISLIPIKQVQYWIYVTLFLASILVILGAVVIHMYLKRREEIVAEEKWLLTGRVSLPQRARIDSEPPLDDTGKGKLGTIKEIEDIFTGDFEHEKVLMESIVTTATARNWKRRTKMLACKMKENINHPNIMKIFGYTEINHKIYVVIEHVSKGTLHSVLKSCRYELTDGIKFNMALDVANGISFLHYRQLAHCLLSSLTCHVDLSWKIKIGSWYMSSLLGQEEPSQFATEIGRHIPGNTGLIKKLYMDPDLNDKTMKMTACDLYSFGMLLLEIFTKEMPFGTVVAAGNVTYDQIVQDKSYKGNISSLINMVEYVPPAVSKIVNKCCVGHWPFRPSIDSLINDLKELKPTKKGTIDVMMETMEVHVDNLEIMIKKHKTGFEEANEKLVKILHELLPPMLATKYFNGEKIKPETFANATVLFCGIAGFKEITTLCSSDQLTKLLNKLWAMFDTSIELFDVCKIHTTGDSYIVCSGLPQKNGTEHCQSILELAFSLIHNVKSSTTHNLPSGEKSLRIRIGISSGPVMAGILGKQLPQYCIFGNTVNLAAKMEFTSEPMKIHVSETTEQICQDHFSQYELAFRGYVETDEKEKIKTFWLVSKNLDKMEQKMASFE